MLLFWHLAVLPLDSFPLRFPGSIFDSIKLCLIDHSHIQHMVLLPGQLSQDGGTYFLHGMLLHGDILLGGLFHGMLPHGMLHGMLLHGVFFFGQPLVDFFLSQCFQRNL